MNNYIGPDEHPRDLRDFQGIILIPLPDTANNFGALQDLASHPEFIEFEVNEKIEKSGFLSIWIAGRVDIQDSGGNLAGVVRDIIGEQIPEIKLAYIHEKAVFLALLDGKNNLIY